MLSEEEIRKLQPYLQTKIDSMRDLTKGYKEYIDKCDPAKISSHAMSLGILRENLEHNKSYLTKKQEKEIDDLKREYSILFQMLSTEKPCECIPKTKK
jgi:HKD family nuclease